MNTKLKLSLLAGLMMAGLANTASAIDTSFPPVVACADQTLGGGVFTVYCLASSPNTYVASMHDDFMSYSIEAIETIQKYRPDLVPLDIYGDWSNLKSGSGTLEVGIAVKANGGGVLNNPDPFPDALSSLVQTTTFEGTWGGTSTDYFGENPVTSAPLTVAEVVQWLNPDLIPAFFFDLTDPQNQDTGNIFFSGEIYITDASGQNVLYTWAFDNIMNHAFDIDAQVLAPVNVPVYIPGSGCDDGFGPDVCVIANNRGSGHPEFVAYAPLMDLAQWAVDGNLFWGHFKITSETAADEEIYLSRFQGPTVPEPGAVALMGLGLLALAFARRRKQENLA